MILYIDKSSHSYLVVDSDFRSPWCKDITTAFNYRHRHILTRGERVAAKNSAHQTYEVKSLEDCQQHYPELFI